MRVGKVSKRRSTRPPRRGLRTASVAMASVLSLGAADVAQAVPLATREELQTILGGPGTVENFEALPVDSDAQVVNCNTGNLLTAATTCESPGLNPTIYGPNLINAGITISGPSNSFQWNAVGYFGAPSKELVTNTQPTTVDFVFAVIAVGLDLRAYSGHGATASIDIYAADDTTLLTTVNDVALSDSGTPVFFGWEDAGGIGRITLSQTLWSWSPVLDNIEWANAVVQPMPEPGALALAGLGLAAMGGLRRRKR